MKKDHQNKPEWSPEEEKRWQEISDRRDREQQNYSRSQKSSDHANSKVYLDISVGGMPVGRLNIELYNDVCPVASENFRGLCTGEYGWAADGTKLDLIDSVFHVVHPSAKRGGGYAVGGDIQYGVGTGGVSVFGAPFPDESFKHRHSGPGLLSLCSQGPNNNTSRFSLTTAKCPALDYRHVIFGRVTDGLAIIERMDQVELERNGAPRQVIRITFAGQLNKTTPYLPSGSEVAKDLSAAGGGGGGGAGGGKADWRGGGGGAGQRGGTGGAGSDGGGGGGGQQESDDDDGVHHQAS